ncbi:peptidoglycan-binding protein [Candidatus Parcubacteria bacterium]|nr:peptidoglycan-binding protein [Candidatus Parcubacteria bacterium]
MEPSQNRSIRNIVVVALVVIAAGVVVWRVSPHAFAPAFCYDFVHDTQFGDRKVSNPVNSGFGGPGGIFYFVPQVPMLQKALQKQGFYIDPYESTGGKVYAAPFFGPSTRSAVMSFQKKYGLPETGEVNNSTIDKLASLYACPKPTASSTPSISATSSPKAK